MNELSAVAEQKEVVEPDPLSRSPFDPRRDRFGDLIPSERRKSNASRRAEKLATKLATEMETPVKPNVRRMIRKAMRQELGRKPTKREVNQRVKAWAKWLEQVEKGLIDVEAGLLEPEPAHAPAL